MSIENNKKVVRAYFEANNTGNHAEALAILSDDFTFESMGKAPGTRYSLGKEQIAAAWAKPGVFKGPVQITINDMVGEGDKVAVRAASHADLKAGGTYSNNYHFLIELENGKIRYLAEYLCTATLINEIWPLRNQSASS